MGPDAATCALIAAALLPLAQNDTTQYIKLSAALSIMAGVLMVVGGIAGLGFIVNFFARPILTGFLTGIGISIITGQLGKLVGVTIVNRDFIPSLLELIRRIGETNRFSLAVGLATLVLLIVMKRLIPRAPLALMALLAAGVGVFFLGWAQVWAAKATPEGLRLQENCQEILTNSWPTLTLNFSRMQRLSLSSKLKSSPLQTKPSTISSSA